MSKLNLKSYGYCTNNTQGMFEVSWEEHTSLLKKLFCGQSDLKFMTDALTKDNWKSLVKVYGVDLFRWFDEYGNVIDDTRKLDKIQEVLTLIMMDGIVHTH